MPAQQDGQPTTGARVPFNLAVTLGPYDAAPPARPPSADPAELQALAARAPTQAELDSAVLVERVPWATRPNAQSFMRYYPVSALEQGVAGRVVLDCLVGEDGALRCAVAEETPSGQGFGLAALGMSREFRVAAESIAESAGRRVRVPIGFSVR